MKLRAALLGDPGSRGWLRGVLGEDADLNTVDAANADAIAEQLGRIGNVMLLFVQFETSRLDERAALVERLTEHAPELAVIAIGSGEPDVMLSAMRAGARDFLVPGRDDKSIPALVERAMRRGVGRVQNRGKVTAVLSAYADTGTAFLAEHLALAGVETLARGEPVLLIDLGLPAGASLVFLNQTQEYSVQDAIQDAYRCDQTLVDTAFARHSSGLHVLSLPESLIGRPAVEAEDLGRFLDVVKGLFAWVVVAVDASLGVEAVRAVIERASQTLLLSEQSIVSIRANQTLLRSLRHAGCPLERTGLVVDRYQKRVDLAPAKLAEPLQLPLLAALSGDQLNRSQAMNAGKSLYQVAPRDDYSQAVRALVQQFLERRMPVVEVNERGGLLGRLLR